MGYTIRIPTSKELSAMKEPGNLLLAFKSATLMITVVSLYFQDLAIVFKDAIRNEGASYILVVPILLIYLVYRKRKMLRALMSTETKGQPNNTRHVPLLGGVLLCTAAIIIYWYGSYTFTPLEYHVLTLPVFAAGLTLILFNYGTLRQAMFPIAFLAFLIPPSSEILYGLGSTLSVISGEASTAIANVFGIPATLTSEFGTPTIMITRPNGTMMNFTVDIASSGVYSLIGFLIFAAFIAFVVRDKLWKKIATFIIGFPLIYLLNILRITIIVVIGYQMGEQLAFDIVRAHLLGGLVLIFLGTLLLLTISEKILKTQIFNRKQDACIYCNPRPASPTETYCSVCGRITYSRAVLRRADVAKIVAVALATIMLLSIQTPVYALTQGPAQILIQTPTGEQGNTQIFPNITGYTVQFLYRDTYSENKFRQDLILYYEYTPQEEGREPVEVTLQIANTTASFRRWETTDQSKVTQLELTNITIFDNPPIIASYFGWQDNIDNHIQLVMYWYETSVFTINNASQQKHVELSLITYPERPEDIPNVEAQLLPIAKAIANYWQPIKTWTFIGLFLSQNGLELALAAAAILVVLIVFYLFELRRQTTANANAYRKLSRQNQQLIDAIQKTQRTTLPTIERLNEAYRTVTGEAITAPQLEQRINELEKVGMIRSTISNIQDEPTQTWKTGITFGTAKH